MASLRLSLAIDFHVSRVTFYPLLDCKSPAAWFLPALPYTHALWSIALGANGTLAFSYEPLRWLCIYQRTNKWIMNPCNNFLTNSWSSLVWSLNKETGSSGTDIVTSIQENEDGFCELNASRNRGPFGWMFLWHQFDWQSEKSQKVMLRH